MNILYKKFEESRIICIIHSASEYNQHVCILLHKSVTNFLDMFLWSFTWCAIDNLHLHIF